MLHNKRILLGIGSGPLTWLAVDILRDLQRAGAEVQVILSQGTESFVPALTFQTLSGKQTISAHALYGEVVGGRFRSLADVVHETDAMLVSPLTPALLAKAAIGCADEALLRALLLHRGPTMLAFPGQALEFQHQLVQQNLQQLTKAGIFLYDKGIPETETAADMTEWALSSQDVVAAMANCLQASTVMTGKTLIVTAGPTQEPIDPVRHISNRSSGKTGFALAEAAQRRGAQVILISGPTHLQAPPGVECIRVQTALEMYQAVMQHFAQADIVIKTAAVADFRPKQTIHDKVKKDTAALNIELEPNPDILAELGKQKRHQILVGFAAETQDLIPNAKQKVQKKNLDLIVANDVSDPTIGFASEYNRVHILDAMGQVENLPKMTKTDMARHILDRVQTLLKHRTRDT
ncbi:MAG: bifunctional phosphopantothenoylcysteine decarboxylase/phosphopantothenate--cysteine ligase CoaBC [bacterium]|nr:bifunctional phosphopantothenoylcysteine decarboxylase/phosphopantothenate--cysteine ligase CoaBC [bacterium]